MPSYYGLPGRCGVTWRLFYPVPFSSFSGAIGMLCTLAAKAFGASEIIVTGIYTWLMSHDYTSLQSDINSERLEMVKKLGATHTVMVMDKDPKIAVKEIQDLFKNQPNITMECSGAQSAIVTGVYVSMCILHWNL